MRRVGQRFSVAGPAADVQPRTFATTFPGLTENPISQGGIWLNGATNGTLWGDVRTTPGLATGNNISASPPYDDPTAVLSGPWGRVQSAEATVVVSASPSSFQEVELRLLTTITPGRIVGYEVLFSVDPGNPYVDIERWDGGTVRSAFVSLVPGGFIVAPQALVTGNRIRATVDLNGRISAYANYGSGWVFIVAGTDTTYRSGAPGIGFFSTVTAGDFGMSAFSCEAKAA